MAARSKKKLTLILAVTAVLMFGFCYLMVPLYTLVCKHAGINGRSDNSAAVLDPHMKVDKSRTVTVEFSTTVHGGLHFQFKPLQHHVKVHPGQTKLVYFYARNVTGHGITVQAIPSITPDESASYLKKTQCFCFTQQYFFNGEKADMPVYFYVDPHLPNDIHDMTLSYTLFDASGFEKKQKHFTKGRIEL